MNWLHLTDATTTLDHDLHEARASLERAISKAWIVGTGGTPPPAIDISVPLRIQVAVAWLAPCGKRLAGSSSTSLGDI